MRREEIVAMRWDHLDRPAMALLIPETDGDRNLAVYRATIRDEQRRVKRWLQNARQRNFDGMRQGGKERLHARCPTEFDRGDNESQEANRENDRKAYQ